MKSLEQVISEPYLMQIGGVGGGSATATNTNNNTDDEAARLEREKQQKEAANSADDAAPAPDSTGAEELNHSLPGQTNGSSGESTGTGESTTGANDFNGATDADRSLEQPLPGGYSSRMENGKRVIANKDGETVADLSSLPAETRTALEALAASSDTAGNQRVDGEPGSSNESTVDAETTDRAITESNSSSDTNSEGDNGAGGQKAQVADPSQLPETNFETGEGKIAIGELNKETDYIHSDGNGKFGICTEGNCLVGEYSFEEMGRYSDATGELSDIPTIEGSLYQSAITQAALEGGYTKDAPTADSSTVNSTRESLTEGQEEILALMENYDPANSGIAEGETMSLQIDGQDLTLHRPGYSAAGVKAKDAAGQDIFEFNGPGTPQADGTVSFEQTQLLASDVEAARKVHNPEGEVLEGLEQAQTTDNADNDGTAIPQPTETVKLTRANQLTAEHGGLKATVIRRGDGVGDDPNHDNAEARSNLLDEQLDSALNTFSTFEGADGEKYVGFYSDGYGPGDERSGVVKLSDLQGKNLGADGWGVADANQKALLQKAHQARTAEIQQFGGVDGYNKAEQLRETIARLQSHSTDTNAEGEHSINGNGANAKQVDSLNNLMARINNHGEPIAGIEQELNALLAEKSSEKGKTLAEDVLEQRIDELTGKGFSTDEIAELKKDGIDHAEIDKAIDTKRNEAHKISQEEFDKAIKQFEGRQLNAQQQAMLDRFKAMGLADKDGQKGYERMGKYLLTELGNLADKVPKPQTKEGTRGDNKPINFEQDGAAKKFSEAFGGEEKLKDIFGDDYANNPQLKEVIKDHEALDPELADNLIKALQDKKTDPKKIAEEYNKILEDGASKLKTDSESLAKDKEAFAKAIEGKKPEELSEEQKTKQAELEKREKALTEEKKITEEYRKLAKTLEKYSRTEEGKLEREGKPVFLEKPKATNSTVETKTEFEKAVIEAKPDLVLVGSTHKGAGYCSACDVLHKDAEFKPVLEQLNSKGLSLLDYDSKEGFSAAIGNANAKFGTKSNGAPALFIKQTDGSYKEFKGSEGILSKLKSYIS